MMLCLSLTATLLFASSFAAKIPAVEIIEPVREFPICAVRCAPTGQAVCAERNGEYRLFMNNCLKFGHYCNTGEEWEDVSMINCAKTVCPTPCPAGGAGGYPFCATNGAQNRQFLSECDFMNFSCQNYKEVWNREMECPDKIATYG